MGIGLGGRHGSQPVAKAKVQGGTNFGGGTIS